MHLEQDLKDSNLKHNRPTNLVLQLLTHLHKITLTPLTKTVELTLSPSQAINYLDLSLIKTLKEETRINLSK